MTTATVPPYLSPSEIGRACDLSRFRALTELKHAGLVECRGGRLRLDASRLRERLPAMYDLVYAAFVLGTKEMRKKVSRPKTDARSVSGGTEVLQKLTDATRLPTDTP
jgi:hypothetical protein